MPTEEVEVLVSGVQGIDGRNPLYPNCRRVDPSTKRDGGFGLNCHGRLVGTWKRNVSPILECRSNVGKSRLLNAMTGRKGLARVGGTPGRTRLLNFFKLALRRSSETVEARLVDLPGYGFAKASKSEIKRWTQLIFDYLRGRPSLRRVCLLIDARHGLKDADNQVMKDLDEAAVSYQIVLTKCDKV